MAIEEQYPSLYTALYNAMTDHKLISDLLQHPEFRRKAGQICSEIAGSAGGADLLQEACLRVLENAGDLTPDRIRSEGEFFGWFSRLARCVRLSHVLSVAAVNSCTDKAARWPDSSADVPPDDMDRFLSHADACLYHTRLLRAEDEELCAAFDRARGFDSRGRILLGEELKARIADHKRRLQHWREAALREGELYGQVALFNAGRKVASCGWFSDFSSHQSRHELDPYAGLQIRGVSSNDPDEDVLLGFYDLVGVRHGGVEKVLELDNGYKVCLKVEERGGNCFDIHFSCVDTKTLEPGGAAAEGGAGVTEVVVEEASGDESPRDSRRPEPSASPDAPPPPPAIWWQSLRIPQAVAALTLLLVMAPLCFLMGRAWGQMEEVENSLLEQMRMLEGRPGTPGTVPADVGSLLSQVIGMQREALSRIERVAAPGKGSQSRSTIGTEPRWDAGTPAPALRSRQEQMLRTKALLEDLALKDERRRPTTYKGVPTSTAELQELFRRLPPGRTAPPAAGRPVSPGTEPANGVDYPRSKSPTLMMSFEDGGLSTGNSVLRVSTNGRAHSANNSVLHVASDDLLGSKLYSALREQSLRVEPMAEPDQKAARYTVRWNAYSTSAGNMIVVLLHADISKEGEKIFPELPSYMGVGHSLDIAYSDAVGQAVKPVMKWISKDGKRLSASANMTGGEGLPVAALPEAKVPYGNRSDAGIDPDPVEQNRRQQGKNGSDFR